MVNLFLVLEDKTITESKVQLLCQGKSIRGILKLLLTCTKVSLSTEEESELLCEQFVTQANPHAHNRTHMQWAISGMLCTSALVQNQGNCTCLSVIYRRPSVMLIILRNHEGPEGKSPFCAIYTAKLKYIVNDINITSLSLTPA